MENNLSFNIKYIAYDDNNRIIKEGEINIHNNYSDIHAKSRLDDYLKKKYPLFKRLQVLSCTEKFRGDSDLFNQIKDIFNIK